MIEMMGMGDMPKKKPYPSVSGLKPNGYYAKIVANNYCGCVSELTSIHQYLFHHFQVDAGFEGVKKTLQQIAIVEMRHLDLLGNTIKELGLYPEFQFYYKDQARFWDASLVSYGKDLKSMLMADIRGEYEAIAQYNWTIDVIGEPQIKALLKRIIEDEEEHIETLYGLLDIVEKRHA